MVKVHVVIGGSHAGKTSFVVNSFIGDSEMTEFKEDVLITETDKYYLIGPYDSIDERTKGTDRVSRADIPKIYNQVVKLAERNDKDVVVEGDKITSRPFMNTLLDAGLDVNLYWIRCSQKTSVDRNMKAGSTSKPSQLRGVVTKAKNLFNEYKVICESYIADSDDVEDFSKFDMSYAKKVEYEQSSIRDDFAVFILTHGRAENVITINTLRKAGYTGKIYLVIDNEDEQGDLYREKYGEDMVLVFDKMKYLKMTDTADSNDDTRGVVMARNASFDLAKDLGLTWFAEYDDDYDSMSFRYEIEGDHDFGLKQVPMVNANAIFEAMITFLDETGSDTIAMAQGGDFIGGTNSNVWKTGLSRKAMNTFIFRADSDIRFMGRINEDVNMYVTYGNKGRLIWTIADIMVNQKPTQQNERGLTDIYKALGTYVKSFYSVIYAPQAVTVNSMGETSRRLHHRVSWNNTTPKILNQKHRKE